MRLGFQAAADLDCRQEIILALYDRDGMTDIAFQADRLLIFIQVTAIMAAKAAGRVDMAEVARVGPPVDFLFVKDRAIIDVPDRLDGRVDLFFVSGIILCAFIIGLEVIDSGKRVRAALIVDRQHGYCL